MTVQQAIEALPLPDYLEARDPLDSELAYVLAVLRSCAQSHGLAEQLPTLLRAVANEIQRVRNDEAQAADPRQAAAFVRGLWSGEPGPN
jgi:hypothetical protein